jgi:hypothetical protein
VFSQSFQELEAQFQQLDRLAKIREYINQQNGGLPFRIDGPEMKHFLSQGTQQVQHPGHAGRPSAPSTGDKRDETLQVNAQTSSSTGTLLGSLSSVGAGAMSSAHSLFVPPYSWMWRVAMSLGSLKYKHIDHVADVPELLSLITGYYAGSPDAVTAAKQAEAGNDKFSLTALSQVFGAPSQKQPLQANKPVQQKFPGYNARMKDQEEDSSMTGWMSSMFGGEEPSMKPATSAASKQWWSQDETGEGDDSNDYYAALMNAAKKPGNSKAHASNPASFLSGFMNPGSKSKKQSSGIEQMLRMAAPALGVDPSLVSMAAPLIGNLL